jgi:regulator of replication initiation timing
MAAIEEEVERLTQENSLLLHRMTQLVASHQAVDQENAHLRQELINLRASVVGVPTFWFLPRNAGLLCRAKSVNDPTC